MLGGSFVEKVDIEISTESITLSQNRAIDKTRKSLNQLGQAVIDLCEFFGNHIYLSHQQNKRVALKGKETLLAK